MSDMFINNMQEIYKILSNDEIKSDILLKYGFLADAVSEGSAENLIKSNRDTYGIILCDTVLNWLKMEKSAGSPLFTKYVQQYPGIVRLITDNNLIDKLLKNTGLEKRRFETFENIDNALKCFGIEDIGSIDSINEDELELNINDEFDDIDFQSLFDDDILEGDDDSEFDDSEFDDYLDDEEDDSVKKDNNNDETGKSDEDEKITSEKSGNTKEIDEKLYKDIKDTWGSKIDSVVQSIMITYSMLYESGYGLVSPSGILTNNGIIRSNTNGQLNYTGERPIDIEIFNAVQAATGNRFSSFADVNEKIDIHNIRNSKSTIIYTGQHLKYMFGHIRFCAREDSLKKYMTKHKILLPSEAKKKSADELKGYKVNDSETKIIKYATIKGWIKETLENIFVRSYIESGVTTDINQDTIDIVNEVNILLSKTLKSCIVVAERKKGVNTRIRISSDEPLDVGKIIKTLTDRLNVGASRIIKVNQIGDYANGVLDVNIIYNDKSYSQDALFAHQVLDVLEEQGIVPSWNNVILGKKDDGTIMTYNFKDTKNPIYGMYAGTRSGKGVMTLNLLASALADGCKVIYVDGKPEIAVTLSDIAWKKGLDACVFNGLEVNPNFGLENRGNCIRQSDRFASAEHIPDDIFTTEDDLTLFLLTVHYLRGIELVIKMAKDRMDKCSPDDWMVVVFDECEQFAGQEKTVESVLDRAYDRRKKAIDPNDPKGTRKINITKDPAAIFIDDYRMWRERLESEFLTGVKSAFGKGNITLFFVWQSSKFPNTYKSSSSLARMVESSRSKMVKIIGKSGVEQGGSNDFGNATTLKDMKWYDKRFSGDIGGFFAIGSNIISGMKVFRPFNIYSDSNGRDLILTNAEAAGLKPEDLIGSQLDEDLNVIHEVGFEGYTDKLLGRIGLDAAQQLNIGFNYANESVVKLGLGNSLLDFIYNAHNFSGNTMADELSELNFDEITPEGTDSIPLDDMDDEVLDFGDDGYDDFEYGDDIKVDTDDSNVIHKYGVRKASPESSTMREVLQQQELIKKARLESEVDMEYYNDDEDVIGRQTFDAGEAVPEGVWTTDEDTGEEVLHCNGKRLTREDVKELSSILNLPINEKKTFQAGGKTGRQRYINDIPRTSEVIGLTTKNSIVASMDDYDTAERFHKTFFKGLWGTRWEFQKRWEAVLASISKNINPNMVTRVTINSDNMFVNNRQVAMMNILGGDADVRLEDIVEFKTLLKKFPQLKSLAMDAVITQRLCEIYPDDPVGELFRQSSSLQTIVFIGDSWGTNSEQVTRQMYMEGIAQEMLAEKRDKSLLKSQIDAVAASKNPRLKQKSPGYQSRVWESTKKFQGDAWKTVGQNITGNNPSLLKATTISAAAIIALGVGGAIAGFGKILSLFNR